jgi:hypothetical protein
MTKKSYLRRRRRSSLSRHLPPPDAGDAIRNAFGLHDRVGLPNDLISTHAASRT